MLTQAELEGDIGHKIKTLRDMAELIAKEGDRPFTANEKEKMDILKREIEECNVALQDRVETDERLDEISLRVDTLGQPVKGLGNKPPSVPATARQDMSAAHSSPQPHEQGSGMPQSFKRGGKMKAFKEGEEEIAYRSGMWLVASLGNERAFRWCNRNDIAVRAMSEGVNAAGGVLVHDEMSQRIIDLRENYGVFRREATIEPMASDVKHISRQTGGLTASFAGEGDTLNESQSTWDSIMLVAKKLYTRTRLSSELDEDSVIDIADRFVIDVARALALKEDQCGFNGDGTALYGGIQGLCTRLAAATTSLSYINASTNDDTFAEVIIDDMERMVTYLPEYVTEPKWYCSRICWGTVFQRLAFALAGNTAANFQDGIQRTWFGYPVVISQVLPKVLTSLDNEVMFLFGDLSLACTLGDRRGIRIAKSEEIHWDTDEIGLKATERVDMVAHDIGDATIAGPIVGLIGNA